MSKPSQVERFRAGYLALRNVAPWVNDPQSAIWLGQVEGESQFGWSIETPDGDSSNNWGMIYAKGDRGSIPVGDTADGKPFTAGAAWWSTPEGGARQFVNLIANAYPEALAAARAGDLWGYARGLWRDGPSYPGHVSKRPSYYGGFPPGHKWSLAPKGTPLHSPVDHHYRILAYARMIQGQAAAAARALGIANRTYLNAPPVPTSGGAGAVSGGAAAAVPLLAAGLLGVLLLSRR